MASSGEISGSGLEHANTIGFGAIFLSSSGAKRSGPERPKKMSAPSIASSNVRLSVSTANMALYWLRSSRPV